MDSSASAGNLKENFPDGVFIHGAKCSDSLPDGIAKFDIKAGKVDSGEGPAFMVQGKVSLGSIPAPFSVSEGEKGKKYMIYLQAYIISSDGRVLWQQGGFPIINTWVEAGGGVADLVLVDSFDGLTEGSQLILLAAGDPITGGKETRVLIGMGVFDL